MRARGDGSFEWTPSGRRCRPSTCCSFLPERSAKTPRTVWCAASAAVGAGGPARDLGVFSTMPSRSARAQPDHGTGRRGPMGRRNRAPPPGLVDQGWSVPLTKEPARAVAMSCDFVLRNRTISCEGGRRQQGGWGTRAPLGAQSHHSPHGAVRIPIDMLTMGISTGRRRRADAPNPLRCQR